MMQTAVKTKKPRKQAVSGRFWAMRTYRERIKDDHKIDPCQGSGHILAYMFDVLVQIYEAYGYSAREAASSIVANNIWGLDIDERATQLAYFSVMMKARQYDRRFFSRNIQPHVYAILESNNLDSHCINYFTDGRMELISAMDTLVKELHDAKEYGSILNVTPVDFDALYVRFDEIRNEPAPGIYSYQTLETLLPFVQVAQAMVQKYYSVVTNPPYMSASGMGKELSLFIKNHFPGSKSDLFAVFIEQCIQMAMDKGFISMITMQSWLFLQSFEELRNKILKRRIINLLKIGFNSFPDLNSQIAHACSFVIKKDCVEGYISTFFDLNTDKVTDDKNAVFLRKLKNENYYCRNSNDFKNIPGIPIAFWLSPTIYDFYLTSQTMEKVAHPKVGMQTSNNDKYLRLWHEISFDQFKGTSFGLKWIKYLKGGPYRKWYGNMDYLLYYNNNPNYILQQPNARVLDVSFLNKVKCTWTDVTSSKNSFRIAPTDSFYDISGHCFFPAKEDQMWLLAYSNSVVFSELLRTFNSTIHCQVGDVARVVVPRLEETEKKYIGNLGFNCVQISKEDWDAFENSWDFQRHSLVVDRRDFREQLALNIKSEDLRNSVSLIAKRFEIWQNTCDKRFTELKKNEEELNRVFIDIYGLQDELTPEVEEKDVTIRKADLQREIRSLFSYAVGCMVGRYSLDIPGLAYAGGEWDATKYSTFLPDTDAIIPICDDEYFEDDIVGRFVKFVEVVYGKDTLEENLKFIADALGGKGSSREVIRNYFINDFYADHLKIYQKRPIYWLFDSGKRNGFKCLIYMHRYQPDTIARIRTDYVHEQQSRYRTAIADLENRIANAGTADRVKLTKQLTKLQEQAEELRVYEEKIHHLADQMIPIDLDDGVKVNYAKFQDVLAKIK